MKKAIATIIVFFIALPLFVNAQDRSVLRAARMSFNAAEKNHKAGNYRKAAQEYTIVLNAIPVSIESRRHLEMRLQSVIGLVDIYYYRTTNFEKACKYIHMYLRDMKVVTAGEVLRASDRLEYLRKEQDYINNYLTKCDSYQKLDREAEKFKNHFDDHIKRD